MLNFYIGKFKKQVIFLSCFTLNLFHLLLFKTCWCHHFAHSARSHFTFFSVVSDGKFGAYMQVNIQNDGPVTIELESPQQKNANDSQSDVA